MRRPAARRGSYVRRATSSRARRSGCAASCRHRNCQRLRKDDVRACARRDHGGAVRGARRDPPPGRVDGARRSRSSGGASSRSSKATPGSWMARTAASSATSCSKARTRRLARPRPPCLAPSPRRQDPASRRDARGALERQPGVATDGPSGQRLALPLLARSERRRRHRYPRELARFRVARLRTQREVDAFLRLSQTRAEARGSRPGVE